MGYGFFQLLSINDCYITYNNVKKHVFPINFLLRDIRVRNKLFVSETVSLFKLKPLAFFSNWKDLLMFQYFLMIPLSYFSSLAEIF